MWDVKDIPPNVIYVVDTFYLNYVGCKVANASTMYQVTSGFTLTMWDVKFLRNSSSSLRCSCFTLTMWDVKSIINALPIELERRFTLTMWDVKHLNSYVSKRRA